MQQEVANFAFASADLSMSSMLLIIHELWSNHMELGTLYHITDGGQ